MTIYRLDSFIDTNGVQLVSHVPDTGGTWSSYLAGLQLEIQNNMLVAETPGDTLGAGIFDSTVSDCWIKQKFGYFSDTGYALPLIIFRSSALAAIDDSWWVQWRGIYEATAQGIYLFSVAAGTPNLEAFDADTYAQDTFYYGKVCLSGSSIKIYTNNVLKIEYTDADPTYLLTETKHGPMMFCRNLVKIDDFMCQSNDPDAAMTTGAALLASHV